MTRRDPYTVARELQAAVDALEAVAYCQPFHQTAQALHEISALARELRRAMVRRVEPINRTEESYNA